MPDLKQWTPRTPPSNAPMSGQHVWVLPLDIQEHGAQLWDAIGGEAQANDHLRYFGWPALANASDFCAELLRHIQTGRWETLALIPRASKRAEGMASFMRTDAEHGSTEVGAVAHGRAFAGTTAATEAHYLMATRVFDELGYRRYEWKLDDRNDASHRAARRLGFTFEGVFRQHRIVPSGNRDTAWYSMLDREWPSASAAFRAWLDPSNFDESGKQLRRLQDFRQAPESAVESL